MSLLPPELKPFYSQFERGEISVDEIIAKAAEFGVELAVFDGANERKPNYPEGDNRNRVGFMYNKHHRNWKILNGVGKKSILAIIDKVHTWVCKVWDKDAYVYDDNRMRILDKNLHGFVDMYFDHEQRKVDFMHQVVDIAMFFMKEDVYYSSRFFQMANNLPFFVLTDAEKENIQTFRKGVSHVDMFTGHAYYARANDD